MSTRETNALNKPSKIRTSGWVKAARIVGILITLPGLSGLGFGIYFFVRTNRFLKTAVKTEARVLDNERRSSDSDSVYVPVFSFVDKAGKEHHARSSWGFYPPKYQVGDSISVLYDPQDPAKADIDSFTNLWLASVIAFVLSAPSVVFGPLFIFVVPIIIVRILVYLEKKKKSVHAGEQISK